MKKNFDTLKPIHGIKMAHGIRRTYYLPVNMCDNTRNTFPYAQNVNLISGEISKMSETQVSSAKIEKRCIN